MTCILNIRTTPAISDADLIRQMRLRNKVGAEALYDKYAVALLLVIIRKVPLKAAAEEVLGKTFLQIWNTFSSYHEEEGTLFGWMKAIASNLANNIFMI